MTPTVLDDFAGPGGWDEGLRLLGVEDVLGVEWDPAACETATAAGHHRSLADVTGHKFEGALRLYVASPSCTLFSMAGHGTGRDALHILADGVRRTFAGEDPREDVRRAIYDEVTLWDRTTKNDKRSPDKRWSEAKVEAAARKDAFTAALVLEPARRIMEHRPPRIALEQVPSVLPLWNVYADCLFILGYSVWCGTLNAADYGVPQTRERAILMASTLARVLPPAPTHSRDGDDGDLFGVQRAKWVSMADALGWEVGHVPAHAPDEEPEGGEGPREGERPPVYVGSSLPRASRRSVDEPAPTVMFGNSANDVRWVFHRPSTTVVGSFRPDVIAPPDFRKGHSRQNSPGSVRVTALEAGVLQSFPADYPWRGSKTKRYEQVGNAVPPLLAAHIVQALGLGTLEAP